MNWISLVIILFIGSLTTVIILGLRRRARYVYFKLVDENGNPVAGETLKARSAKTGTQAAYMGNFGGQTQYQFSQIYEGDKLKNIGKTAADGTFKIRFVISNCYAFELGTSATVNKQQFPHLIIVQHVSKEGNYPAKPFLVKRMKDTQVLIPEHLL
jgi:hypothetical protein